MGGREFLDLAQEVVGGGSEKHWRGAAGRAYDALMLECRDALARWGFSPAPRENIHPFARMRFSNPADNDLKAIGVCLDRLGRLRNHADYNLAPGTAFATDAAAQQAIQNVAAALSRLDALDADPARRAAAVAAIRAAFP